MTDQSESPDDQIETLTGIIKDKEARIQELEAALEDHPKAAAMELLRALKRDVEGLKEDIAALRREQDDASSENDNDDWWP